MSTILHCPACDSTNVHINARVYVAIYQNDFGGWDVDQDAHAPTIDDCEWDDDHDVACDDCQWNGTVVDLIEETSND